MRSLLDANFLIAMVDQDHTSHHLAKAWFSTNKATGWASCSITENATIRVLSNPSYSKVKVFSSVQVVEFLIALIKATDHAFWPSDLSMLDRSVFDYERILGPKQLTDVYLLGLAVRHGGRLVTHDRRITAHAVSGAGASHLVVL